MHTTKPYPDLHDPKINSRMLARIGRYEPDVHAWAWFDPDLVVRVLKEEAKTGPLAGLAIGVKDIIDVAGMPTGNGLMRPAPTPLASTDADCVALLRQAGAIPIGKTVTAEMAYAHPGLTRNPCNLAHTPGGSSSGSAAAVACGMLSAALGTQTGGSIIRPAAYCGVVGFKPTYGLVSMKGVTGASASLDTLGWLTTNVELADAIAQVLLLSHQPAPTCARLTSLRIACLDALYADPDDDTKNVLSTACATLRAAGAHVFRMTMRNEWHALTLAHKTIIFYEMARTIHNEHAAEWPNLSTTLRAACDHGSRIDAADYHQALDIARSCETRLLEALKTADVIITPSAKGPAPYGLDSTGESTFNRVWTLLGWPAIHLPTTSSSEGLPLGVQLVGKPAADRQLLQIASQIHQQIDRRHESPINRLSR